MKRKIYQENNSNTKIKKNNEAFDSKDIIENILLYLYTKEQHKLLLVNKTFFEAISNNENHLFYCVNMLKNLRTENLGQSFYISEKLILINLDNTTTTHKCGNQCHVENNIERPIQRCNQCNTIFCITDPNKDFWENNNNDADKYEDDNDNDNDVKDDDDDNDDDDDDDDENEMYQGKRHTCGICGCYLCYLCAIEYEKCKKVQSHIACNKCIKSLNHAEIDNCPVCYYLLN